MPPKRLLTNQVVVLRYKHLFLNKRFVNVYGLYIKHVRLVVCIMSLTNKSVVWCGESESERGIGAAPALWSTLVLKGVMCVPYNYAARESKNEAMSRGT